MPSSGKPLSAHTHNEHEHIFSTRRTAREFLRRRRAAGERPARKGGAGRPDARDADAPRARERCAEAQEGRLRATGEPAQAGARPESRRKRAPEAPLERAPLSPPSPRRRRCRSCRCRRCRRRRPNRGRRHGLRRGHTKPPAHPSSARRSSPSVRSMSATSAPATTRGRPRWGRGGPAPRTAGHTGR